MKTRDHKIQEKYEFYKIVKSMNFIKTIKL